MGRRAVGIVERNSGKFFLRSGRKQPGKISKFAGFSRGMEMLGVVKFYYFVYEIEILAV